MLIFRKVVVAYKRETRVILILYFLIPLMRGRGWNDQILYLLIKI